jgi:hypothetical protein
VNIRVATSIAAIGALSGMAVASAGASGSPGAHAAACHVKNDIEAIIDDSGSMSYTDPNRLRMQGINLLMNTPGNERKTLGAVEFGDTGVPLFGPGPIGANRNAFSAIMDARLRADNGTTNYNDAFAVAGSHNPNADARIFLTDGDPTEIYNNAHRGGPPTYVIGFGGVTREDILKSIASDTGGTYRKANDASGLQAAINVVNTRINCQSPPKQYTDTFRRRGSRRHSITIPRGVRSVFFALSWANSADSFDIGSFRLVGKHHKLVGKARVRRLKVRRRRGATFVSVKVSGLRSGKLGFRVRARRLSSSSAGVRLITQASRSRRR